MKRQFAEINYKGDVTVLEKDISPLKDGEVLLKVHASLISPGTEISGVKMLRETPVPGKESFSFGYSSAGEILEIKGDCKGLKPGMRVAAMGGHAEHANYACVPVNMIVPIPDNVTFEQAAYACLGATSLQAVRRTEPLLGEYGAVLGLGIVGNLTAQLCMLSGSRVIGWEGIASRIEIAHQCGIKHAVNFREADTTEVTNAFTAPYGTDFGIMAFGGPATEAFQSVMKCMKVSADGHIMGRVTLVGGCTIEVRGGARTGNADIRSAARTGPGYHDEEYEYGKEYPAAFVQFTTQRNLREIIQLISEKRLLVDPMTTHTLPLEQVGDAADLLVESPDKALGIILKMSH